MYESVHGGLYVSPLLWPRLRRPFFPSEFNFSSLYYLAFLTYLIYFGYCQEKLYGKPITVSDRESVEEKADDMLLEAQGSDVAFLVVGDPFG